MSDHHIFPHPADLPLDDPRRQPFDHLIFHIYETVDILITRVAHLHQHLLTQQEVLMAAIDDLRTAVTAATTEMAAGIDELKNFILNHPAVSGASDADLADLTSKLNTATDAMKAAVTDLEASAATLPTSSTSPTSSSSP